MTGADVARAARWLANAHRAQQQRMAQHEADKRTDALARRRRVARQQRHANGRWRRHEDPTS